MCVAIFFIFMQWGLLEAAKKESIRVYEFFDFDLALISKKYQFMYEADTFDRVRLIQAQALGSIEEGFNLNVGKGRWEDPETKIRSSLMLIGIDKRFSYISEHSIRTALEDLAGDRAIIIDEFSHRDYGVLKFDKTFLINRHEVDIKSFFKLGFFFYADGSAVAANNVFMKLTGRHSRNTSIGLLRLKRGFDPAIEKQKLVRMLPQDVVVLTRDELLRQEQFYFVKVKPVGLLFDAGVVIAFLTGIIILFQVMATDVATRMKEYSTLVAMGFRVSFLYSVAVSQILILSLCAFVPAVLLSIWLFNFIDALTHLPIELTAKLLGFVLLLTLSMAFLVTIVVLRRLSRAHPAELF